jgi:hypothetical protein
VVTAQNVTSVKNTTQHDKGRRQDALATASCKRFERLAAFDDHSRGDTAAVLGAIAELAAQTTAPSVHVAVN